MKNLVILIGRIAAAPETRHAGETAITSFTVVTDRPKLVDGKTVKGIGIRIVAACNNPLI